MSDDVLSFGLGGLRATDSNSLLRLLDQAHETLKTSQLQQERARADKAIQRIAKELRKRNVSFAPGHGPVTPGGRADGPPQP